MHVISVRGASRTCGRCGAWPRIRFFFRSDMNLFFAFSTFKRIMRRGGAGEESIDWPPFACSCFNLLPPLPSSLHLGFGAGLHGGCLVTLARTCWSFCGRGGSDAAACARELRFLTDRGGGAPVFVTASSRTRCSREPTPSSGSIIGCVAPSVAGANKSSGVCCGTTECT